jgi:hypothetical protein
MLACSPCSPGLENYSVKHPFIINFCTIVFLLSACSAVSGTSTPDDRSPLQTQAVGTAFAMLTQSAPAPTGTALVATKTPTSSRTPGVDYSVIKFESLYLNGTSETVLIFALHGVRGEFYVTGNDYTYMCKPAPTDPDQLFCRGEYQPPGYEVLYKFFVVGQVEPILTRSMIIPSPYPPTPEGMRCEIEPLWVAPLTGTYGCYAVTCYLNGQYYDGTADTCIQPWRWPVP